ncbi:9238_t:CDS:2 [Gigaspora margarita]|uniref:9238_t:CDS:1 n=1 Tax=Gigaspora margarita TaxID=4874 RepID=A0ABN7V8V8_GIGMA|nr:9238_t:CDS:2 [Gigaspora margarita]
MSWAPCEATTLSENIEKVKKLELGIVKMCTKWVPHVLTNKQKKNWVDVLKKLLKKLQKGFNNIIISDEI